MPDRLDAFDRIIALCSVRDRSCLELRERLMRDGYDEQTVEAAIERSVACGLVDDLRFADAFIRGKVSAGKGEIAIANELLKHGLEPENLQGWPEAYGLDEDSQTEQALSYLMAHPPKAKDAWGAGFRKLVSRGFSQGVASRATRLWAESRD